MALLDSRTHHSRFQDFRTFVSDVIERHPKIVAGTGMVAFGLLYLYGLPNIAQLAADPSIVEIDNVISSTGLGRETLEGLQFIMHSLSDLVPAVQAPSTIGKVAGFIAETLTITGVAASLAKLGTDSVKNWWDSTFNRAQRMLNGTEPLLQKEFPSHVLIGDSSIISDLAKKITPDKNKRKPIVGIHPDIGVPPVWGSKIHYHFRAEPHELTDTFTQSESDMSYIQATGLDRADEITFACMDQDNALFYGNDAKMAVRPSFVTTLLNKIMEGDKEALIGKKINVIMNDSPQLGEVKAVRDDLLAVGLRAGFEPKIISPEQLALATIQENIKKVMEGEQYKTKGNVSIMLVGEGNKESDKKMLQRFKTAIYTIGEDKNISVSLIEDTEIDGVSIDGQKVTKQQQSATLMDKFTESDLIYVYGDHDDGTTSLVNNILNNNGVSKDKVHAFIERPNAKYDVEEVYLDPQNVHCIYDMVIGAYS